MRATATAPLILLGIALATSALVTSALTTSARASESLAGTYALPDGRPKVTASLTTSPDSGLRRMLDVAMTPFGAAVPVKQYDTELTKQLHVIAVSADLRDFVHEHGEQPDPDGHFRVPLAFPRPGPWHVYADGVPHGLGQQVMRFDLVLGAAPPSAPTPVLASTGLESVDGRYSVRFDSTDLKAVTETPLSLHVLRDGRPAPDITPFLGVAAHAVFIDAADLSYVHVHAAPPEAPSEATGTGDPGAPMHHDTAGMADMPGMAGSKPEAAGMEGMGAPLAPGSRVPSDLGLHVRAPKTGTYVLWIQFDGGGAVRTVRFVVPVT